MKLSYKTKACILRLAAALLCAAAVAILWQESPVRAETLAEKAFSEKEPLERDLYEFSIKVIPMGRSVRMWGLMRLSYVNRTDATLYNIVLRLHANDVEPNCMAIASVAVNGQSALHTLSQDGSILNISLPMELKAGESASVFLRMDMTVPQTGGRFGINSTGIMFGNALPIAAVYENGAWRDEPYYENGDSFYSLISDYKVALSVPAGYSLAHTGSRVSRSANGAYDVYYIAAPMVREFAFALIEKAYVEETKCLGGRVTVHALADSRNHAKFAAGCAVSALEFFSEKIGDYPYSDLYVAPFDLSGGMEYPGLIMIYRGDIKESRGAEGALVIGHETAHQWFYNLVGSDQVNAPWLDEALVEYLGFDFLRSYMGDDAANKIDDERYGQFRTTYERKLRLDSALSEFAGADYFYVVYAYGYEFYYQLVKEIGSGAFYEGLKTYYYANYMGVGTKERLIAAFSEAAGRDLIDWFEAHIQPPQGAEDRR